MVSNRAVKYSYWPVTIPLYTYLDFNNKGLHIFFDVIYFNQKGRIMNEEKLEYKIWDVFVEDQHGKLYKLDSPWINENWKYDEQSETLQDDI